MNMDEKIKDQIDRMNRIIEWVKVCDNKTAILMSVALIVPTFTIGTDWVLTKLEKVITLIIDACKNGGEGYYFSWANCVALLFFCTTIVLTSVCLFYFILVLKAKTKENTYGDGIKENTLIYFNNISKIANFELYKQQASTETQEAYYEDLLSQTYINAKRCAEKFADYDNGIHWLCYAVTSLVIFIVSLFFINV